MNLQVGYPVRLHEQGLYQMMKGRLVTYIERRVDVFRELPGKSFIRQRRSRMTYYVEYFSNLRFLGQR